jgi:hypothetical protein
MYQDWLANAAAAAATLMAVVLAVLTHYEGLLVLSRGLKTVHARKQRIKVLYAILTVVLLHVIEIWIFGLVFWFMVEWPSLGHLAGPSSTHLFDAVYFSAVTFSTVGYGEITPVGPIRILAGTESLVGLVLITWSASFTFLEMDRFWHR